MALSAVILNAPTNVQSTQLDLSWSQNTDSDPSALLRTCFAAYKVYRSPQSPVSTRDTLRATLTNSQLTTTR